MVHTGDHPLARFMRTPETNRTESTWQGDDLSHGKETNMTRIMFHNVNGLSLRGTEGMDMFVNEQASLDIDIQGITEHCLDTTKFQVYQTAQDLVRQHYSGQSILQLNSSSEPAINLYKPGGTGFLVLGDIVSRQEPQGRGGDPMGRWSFLHLRRKDRPPLTIITAYQVCPRPTNILGNTAYHQQIRALSVAGTPNVHPRRAFINDLGEFLSTLQARGHDIILGGDFNEALEDKNSGILRLATSHNLTDPFLHRFPHHQSFGTHALGHRRIDSVLITPNLLPSLKRIGYAPFHQYSKPSDHRPIIIEFQTKVLFGYQNDNLQSASNRTVKSNDKVAVTRFISTWYKEIHQRHGFELQEHLNNDTAGRNIVEVVDEIIGTCGKTAEQACKRRRPEFYSRKLVQQRLRVSILRGHLQALRLGSDRTPQLKRRMMRGGLDFPLPPAISTTLQVLRQATIDLQETCKNHAESRQQEFDERIEEAALRRNKSKAQILRSIQKIENNKQTYRILQQMKRKATESHKIDRIEIPSSWPTPHHPIETIAHLEDPKSCTDWRQINNPSEVEYYLLLRNRLHFGQAEGTPFTCQPLNEDFDWPATMDKSDNLLDGAYTFNSTVPNCDDILQACRQATSLDSLPAELKTDDFRGKIKAWKETKATSPSGRHLGWYKSLFAKGTIQEPEAENQEEDENHDEAKISVQDMQDAIAALMLSVINYCIRNSYVLNRWKTVVNPFLART